MVNYSESRTAEEICESSSKMITFIDLAGHHKYLKTTIFGLTSYCPDFAMLVVGANTGIGECRRQVYGIVPSWLRLIRLCVPIIRERKTRES